MGLPAWTLASLRSIRCLHHGPRSCLCGRAAVSGVAKLAVSGPWGVMASSVVQHVSGNYHQAITSSHHQLQAMLTQKVLRLISGQLQRGQLIWGFGVLLKLSIIIGLLRSPGKKTLKTSFCRRFQIVFHCQTHRGATKMSKTKYAHRHQRHEDLRSVNRRFIRRSTGQKRGLVYLPIRAGVVEKESILESMSKEHPIWVSNRLHYTARLDLHWTPIG